MRFHRIDFAATTRIYTKQNAFRSTLTTPFSLRLCEREDHVLVDISGSSWIAMRDNVDNSRRKFSPGAKRFEV